MSSLIPSAELTSFIQFTLKLKNEKNKLNKKEAIKENSKAGFSNKKIKKSLLGNVQLGKYRICFENWEILLITSLKSFKKLI